MCSKSHAVRTIDSGAGADWILSHESTMTTKIGLRKLLDYRLEKLSRNHVTGQGLTDFDCFLRQHLSHATKEYPSPQNKVSGSPSTTQKDRV